MALANVGSFQYLMTQDITKTKSGPEKGPSMFLLPGAQMTLETFGLFQFLSVHKKKKSKKKIGYL